MIALQRSNNQSIITLLWIIVIIVMFVGVARGRAFLLAVCARRVVSCGERTSGRRRRRKRTKSWTRRSGRTGRRRTERCGRGEKKRKQDACIITFYKSFCKVAASAFLYTRSRRRTDFRERFCVGNVNEIWKLKNNIVYVLTGGGFNNLYTRYELCPSRYRRY